MTDPVCYADPVPTSPEPVRYIPDGFDYPENPQDALRAAAALLAEEGRWRQGSFFKHNNEEHPEFIDNPYCNGWGACAVGALQIVTLGIERFDLPDYRQPMDPTTGTWSRVTKWELAEDRYMPFVEGYALDEEGETLSPHERVYIEAHQLLDRAAAVRGFDSAIACNDSESTTRTDVIAMFNDAAALDTADMVPVT